MVTREKKILALNEYQAKLLNEENACRKNLKIETEESY